MSTIPYFLKNYRIELTLLYKRFNFSLHSLGVLLWEFPFKLACESKKYSQNHSFSKELNELRWLIFFWVFENIWRFFSLFANSLIFNQILTKLLKCASLASLLKRAILWGFLIVMLIWMRLEAFDWTARRANVKCEYKIANSTLNFFKKYGITAIYRALLSTWLEFWFALVHLVIKSN